MLLILSEPSWSTMYSNKISSICTIATKSELTGKCYLCYVLVQLRQNTTIHFQLSPLAPAPKAYSILSAMTSSIDFILFFVFHCKTEHMQVQQADNIDPPCLCFLWSLVLSCKFLWDLWNPFSEIVSSKHRSSLKFWPNRPVCVLWRLHEPNKNLLRVENSWVCTRPNSSQQL